MNEYWSKRLADNVYDSQTPQMLEELNKKYRQASSKLKKEIMQLYIKLLEVGELSTTNLYAYGRYSHLLEQINMITGELIEGEIAVFKKTLNATYKKTFKQTSLKLTGSGIVWGIQNTKMMEQVVNANFKGANFSSRIWGKKNKLNNRLEKSVVDCIASGQSKDKMITKLMQDFGASFSDADRLARTEVMRVINAGQVQSYIANGRTHGRYLIGKDDRTCDYCKKRAKETKEISEPLDQMEAVHHPRCRCTIIPVINKL